MSRSLTVTLAVDARVHDGHSLDVTFDVPPGVTVLFGPSGAGKSRTLACISGILRPHRGRVTLGPEVWFDGVTGKETPIHRRRIAYVFQSLALFPHMTVAENVGYGLPRSLHEEERRAIVLDLLSRMRVAKLADRTPRTLSGGEAQRVALARAFAIRPNAILLDEPFSALDAAVKTELLIEIGEHLARLNVPVLFVTHHIEDAERLGDRIVVLDRGRVTHTRTLLPRTTTSPRRGNEPMAESQGTDGGVDSALDAAPTKGRSAT